MSENSVVWWLYKKCAVERNIIRQKKNNAMTIQNLKSWLANLMGLNQNYLRVKYKSSIHYNFYSLLLGLFV